MSYHDLYITTAEIPRTSISDLPYGLEVNCSRVTGWTLWDMNPPPSKIAGEYDSDWLVLDVDGHVIVDSRDQSLDYEEMREGIPGTPDNHAQGMTR